EDGRGIAGAAAACAATRTAGATCTPSSTGTTRAAAGIVGRGRFDIPVHAVKGGLQCRVVLAVVAEGAVVIERNKVCDRPELLFRRRAARPIAKARVVDGLVLQAADDAGVAADRDRESATNRDL